MALELVYTSAPKGLKAGSSGYCTVACTASMPPSQVDLLESFSGYKALFDGGGQDEGRNPVCFSHYRPRIAGKTLSVLSRVSSYGFDYSGRTNKLAHHVIVDPGEQVVGGPASLLLKSGFMVTQWSGDARLLPNPKNVPNISPPRGPARQWEKVTGDAGWAGVLAQGFTGPESAPVYLIIEPGMDALTLIYEASLILRPELRWQVTFSSYLSTLAANTSCHWRCCLPDSPILAEARRARSGLVIDLRRGRELGIPRAAEDYLEAARTGKSITAPAPRKVAASRASSAPDENDFEIRIVEEVEVSEVPEREGEPFIAPRRINSVEPRLPKFALPLVASVVIGIVAIVFLVSAPSSTPKMETQRKDLADGVNPTKMSDSEKISNRSEPQLRPAPNRGDTTAQPVKPPPNNAEREKTEPKKEESAKADPKADKESPSKSRPGKEDTAKAEAEKPTDTSKEPKKDERPARSPAAEIPKIRTGAVVEFRLADLPDKLGAQGFQLRGLAIPEMDSNSGLTLRIDWKGGIPAFLHEMRPEGAALQIHGKTPYGGSEKFFLVRLASDSFFFQELKASDENWTALRKSINFISIFAGQSKEESYRCYFKTIEIELPDKSVDIIDGIPTTPRIPLTLGRHLERQHSLPQFSPEGTKVETDVPGVEGKLTAGKEDNSIELVWPSQKTDLLGKLHRFRKVMESQPKSVLESIRKQNDDAKKRDELKTWWQDQVAKDYKDCFQILSSSEKADKWYDKCESLWKQLDTAEKFEATEKKRQNASEKEKKLAEDNKKATERKLEDHFEDIRSRCLKKIKSIQAELIPENRKITLRVKPAPGQEAIIIKLGIKCIPKEK